MKEDPKILHVREMAEQGKQEITETAQAWMSFLDTACRFPKYKFYDQILIYMQKPEATACAPFELWSRTMHCKINRGTHGIMLLDDTGKREKVRYVFDRADVTPMAGGRKPYIWEMQESLRDEVAAGVAGIYGMSPAEGQGLGDMLCMAAEDITDTEFDYFFPEYVEQQEMAIFADELRDLVRGTVSYMLLRRAGIEPLEYIQTEMFDCLDRYTDDLDEIVRLGDAITECYRPVSEVMGSTVKKVLSEKYVLEKDNRVGYNNFNTLIRKSSEEDKDYGDHIQAGRGRTASEHRDRGRRRSAGDREIRDDAQAVPYGQPVMEVPGNVPERGTLAAPEGSGQAGKRESGRLHEEIPSEASGTGQGTGPDGMDGLHEHGAPDGGGRSTSGTHLQLTGQTGNGEYTENEQKAEEDAMHPSAFYVPQKTDGDFGKHQPEDLPVLEIADNNKKIPDDVIDLVLKHGIRESNCRHRVIFHLMSQPSEDETAAFLKDSYKTGGMGFIIGTQQYSAWYNSDGLKISRGFSVYDGLMDSVTMTWEEVARRIKQLVYAGEYAAQEICDEAYQKGGIQEFAMHLTYMFGEMNGRAEYEKELFGEEGLSYGFPDNVERVTAFMADRGNMGKMGQFLQKLSDAYMEDPSIMRFKFYTPDKMLSEFKPFLKEFISFDVKSDYLPPEYEVMLTQDHLYSFLGNGGPFSNGRLSIYAYFTEEGRTIQEKAKFLQDAYGIGGQSDAIKGAASSWANYDGKGISLSMKEDGHEECKILLSYKSAAQMVSRMISAGKFLRTSDRKNMPAYERTKIAGKIMNFYARLPQDIYRPFNPADYNAGEGLAEMIKDKKQLHTVVKDMETALVSIRPDFEGYDKKQQLLDEVRGYAQGVYSIYPELSKMKKSQKEKNGQLSLSDFMELSGPDAGKDAGDNTGTNDNTLKTGEISGNTSVEQNDREIRLLINEYCIAEFETEADFSDLKHVDLAYSTTEDERHEIQIFTDMTEKTIFYQVDDEIVRTVSSGSYEEYISYLQTLYFDSLISDAEEAYFEMHPEQDPDQGYIDASGSFEDDAPEIKNDGGSGHEQKENADQEATQISKGENFRFSSGVLAAVSKKERFAVNINAIQTLMEIEKRRQPATPAEQGILAGYAGWGGLQEAFDERKSAWQQEYALLKNLLEPGDYASARESVLNAFYTQPYIARSIYRALEKFGFSSGNILDPSMGTGNFFGTIPESMAGSKLYGVELDGITGRIAKQLYPEADIKISGFEKTDFPDDFFDVVVGNVPFGNYGVADKRYDKQHFMIHDYFFAKSLDKVRSGGIVAMITSKGTMDKANPQVRQYLAERAELIGAIRLPNTAFKENAGTDVTSDIIFLKKREQPSVEVPDWVYTENTESGVAVNSYFASHPEMILGEMKEVSGPYGMETTCVPYPDADLPKLLEEAVNRLEGTIDRIDAMDPDDDFPEVRESIPAAPDVKNYSYTVVGKEVYYRVNSIMERVNLPETTKERIIGMVGLRNTARALIDAQLYDGTDEEIRALQKKLSDAYDSFYEKYGCIGSKANKKAYENDSSYCLLSSLEILDDDGNLKRKADIFSKKTIRKAKAVTSADNAAEALAVSISEKAGVDMAFMAGLTGKSEQQLADELKGVIFKNPDTGKWENGDQYLSGNIREKLKKAENAAKDQPEYEINAAMLKKVMPKDLEASEIEVRLGATWVDPEIYRQFMQEIFNPQWYYKKDIDVVYSKATGKWAVTNKSKDRMNVTANTTYGTNRMNGYALLEECLNLHDVEIKDKVEVDGKERYVVNKKETMLANQKQDAIRQAFSDWVFKDPERRQYLCKKYNQLFNSVRPRQFDGEYLEFPGMTPEIKLMKHQKDAAARIILGENTLLAHVVGAGKTFTMIAGAMESKRLGLCNKNMFVVPNHLTEQWGADFMRLYPGANILVAKKKDFEPMNRKKFCARIATGEYDAVIIGHTQFEKIPLSLERQKAFMEQQIDEIIQGIEDAKMAEGNSGFTVKQLERSRKNLQIKLDKLNSQEKKDDVVTFEQLGVDRLFVDESHYYKNLFLYTKMRNVAGISQTEAQKSSDMLMKCRYLDEITGGKGITFATGTPISNSMTELYTNMRYLQNSRLSEMGLSQFDAWASTFGETKLSVELSPEGNGYRTKTRFAKFYNLPELMSVFKECADVRTADMLELPVPEAVYETVVTKPSDIQKKVLEGIAERADKVRKGSVDSTVDNMLKITNDGRKLALDQRLINPLFQEEADSKINKCAQKAVEIWKETTKDRAAQLIFCDMSTPGTDAEFNVYDDLKEKLMAAGVPEKEIAYIHDANTETKKAELFKKVRDGSVRFLLGSTAKMGAGTNVQERLIALHHLDVPWRPSDIEQREGRIIRQGNQYEKVRIYRYVTENTFDAYSWQTIENKQKFIGQIMTSKTPVRSAEDIDSDALSYAEVKALATGNPYIKEKMSLEMELTKLKVLRSEHINQKYKMEDDIAINYPAAIRKYEEMATALEKDASVFASYKDKKFAIRIGNRMYTDTKEAGEAIIQCCRDLDKAEHADIGNYCGFGMRLMYNAFMNEYVLSLKNEAITKVELGTNPFGNIQRINNALDKLPENLSNCRNKVENLKAQLKKAEEEVKKPFPKEAEYQEKMARLSELDAMLNHDEQANVVEGFKKKTGQCFHPIFGMGPEMIEGKVKKYVESKLNEYGIHANIVDMAVTGSRCRGMEREDSDIDIVIEYSSKENLHEDEMFNILHEDQWLLGGVLVDINPIRAEETGTLESYLPEAEKYLQEKSKSLSAVKMAEQKRSLRLSM